MTTYIDPQESLQYRLAGQHQEMVKVVAEHYIGNNPEIPFIFRAFHNDGILQTEEGLYDIDLKGRLPEAKLGDYAYAACTVWSDAERSIDLGLLCYGPTQLYMNGERIYRSNAEDEVKHNHKVTVGVTFTKGWNTLFVKLRNTTAGFGCAIGAEEAKVRILHVLSPFEDRAGQAGWIYSESTREDRYPEQLPELFASEVGSGLSWYPRNAWEAGEAERTPFERIFDGPQPGRKACAWSRLYTGAVGGAQLELKVNSHGPARVWVDGTLIHEQSGAGVQTCRLPVSYGAHDVLVESTSSDVRWGTQLELPASADARWEQPQRIHGYDLPWLYLGPFGSEQTWTPEQVQTLHKPFAVETNQTSVYWRVDLPGTWVRPYYENAYLSNKWTTSGVTNFARWDYPLGVTMYGLLKTGRLLERQDIIEYALNHIRMCTDYYEYALWDKAAYGFPSVNQQLVLIKMLDNCGSFGSSMLEAYREAQDEGFVRVAEQIAAFIRDRLERREDGAFYRICAGEYSENSMWADDLYMSTPFMRRYYEMTGDEAFLDDAARQFLLYKNYLYMPEERIMSHVYDFKYGTATKVPWGRGNGWCAFSLSELLEVLSDEHPNRKELLAFYNELCQGYLALQGKEGLWHQVLNDPEAYEESSCTAMFIYAFARGVRYGWLDQSDEFAAAALKGWSGLTAKSIDRHGNVYGVCSGSRYSFTPEYYKEELRTVTNDNHGIGIMMLAGVEVCQLLNWMDTDRSR